MSLKSETAEWMKSMGFQDNSEAEIPNFIFSLKQFIEPDETLQEIAKNHKDWDPLEEWYISLQTAEFFYLKQKDKEKSY